MGYDCVSTLTIDGRSFRGTAVLEQKELVFRGDLRLSIPLSLVEEVHVREGDLFLTFGGRRAVLTLGADAAKWAGRISHPPSRAEKLGIKSGMRIALIGLDDPALLDEIESTGASLVGAASKALDLIFFAARTPRDLERLTPLPARLKPSGALWLVRAKGRGAPITEAESMAAGKRVGLVDVKVVSYSDTHSAEKYVIPAAKRRSDPPAAAARRTARATSPASRK